MRQIRIIDATLREDTGLSFKEKIEMVKQLEKLHVDVVEVAPVENEKVDTLALRTMATTLKTSVLACVAGLTTDSVKTTWNAIREAAKPRLVIAAPVSSVQMEYLCHKKPAPMLQPIGALVTAAKELCPDVEFSALDATRADHEFLFDVVRAALAAGATTVTLCDSAGIILPDELAALVKDLLSAVPEMKDATLVLECSNALSMATAAAIAGVMAGASAIKVVVGGADLPTIESVNSVLEARGDALGIRCGLSTVNLKHAVWQLTQWSSLKNHAANPFDNQLQGSGTAVAPEGDALPQDADIETVVAAAKARGYDLSEEDKVNVYREFRRVSGKKAVRPRDLDAIVASTALQVQPTYRLVSFVSNSGNIITSTACVVLEKDGQTLQGVGSGDGPIDAAFLTIEKIIGHHYEVDDFQIQAVTEGREAMGDALVKLRAGGRLFSGKGISTDIVGASIRAYLSALNKIVYEENA